METTRAGLLQLCLPSLTGSGGIDGPKQFGALTSHTLVEKAWSNLNNLTDRSRHSPRHYPIWKFVTEEQAVHIRKCRKVSVFELHCIFNCITIRIIFMSQLVRNNCLGQNVFVFLVKKKVLQGDSPKC